MLEQILQKPFDIRSFETPPTKLQIECDPFLFGRHGQRVDCRNFRVFETIADRWRLSRWSPSAFDIRNQQKATFVQKNKVCAKLFRAAANLWPHVAFPTRDGRFIALGRTAFRFLATPTECAQDFPNVPRMIRDMEMLFDESRDAPQCPKIGFVTRLQRAVEQQAFQLPFLLGGQVWWSTWDRFGFQSGQPFAFESVSPAIDRTSSRAQSTRNSGRSFLCFQQLDGAFPPLL